MKLSGSQVLALTFAGLIAAGTVALKMPGMTAQGAPALKWEDALFLSSSAACVTGLATVNYADQLSSMGHFALLALFQIGGLGIMTVSAAFAALLGRGVSPSSHATLSDVFSGGEAISLNRLLLYSIAVCAICEGTGAVALFFLVDAPTVSERAWTAVFHSVSAFCNAGFSLYPENLVHWNGNHAAQTVVMLLIVAGGLGFFVIMDGFDRLRGHTRFARLQTKIVLFWTVLLIGLGTLAVHLSEFDNTLAGMSPGDQWFHSLFQSVTARTAGFNTIDIGAMRHFGLFIIMSLMFVGGGPGSTAGGVKTTTIGIVFAALASHLRGRADVEAFGRRIPREQVQKAFLIVSLSVAIMTVFFIVMRSAGGYAPSEAHGRNVLIPLGFETISAFCTVGLSAGVSPELDTLSKLLMSFLMLVGRLGPLTIAVALATEAKPHRYRLPAESVMVG